jgi:hypothetical protein
MRNSRGDKDAMWTLTFIAFVVTTISYLVSILNVVQIGDTVVSFNKFDGLGYAAVVLVPLLMAYFGRRYTTATNETAQANAVLYAEISRGAESTSQKPVAAISRRSTPAKSATTKNLKRPAVKSTTQSTPENDLEEPLDEV